MGITSEQQRLIDENEQLRTALETAIEENAHILEDRDRLLGRVAVLARELHAANAAHARAASVRRGAHHDAEVEAHHSETEEELRVAFEELQVLTEELEAANTSLHEANTDLEARVAARTREIELSNAALRKTEATFRTLVDGMPQLVWRAIRDGSWTWSSRQWAGYTGQSEEQSLRHGWLLAIHPDDRQKALDAWSGADASHPLEFSSRIYQASEARYRRFSIRAAPVLGDDGTIIEWLGTSTDMDDLLQLQERQSVLVAELQHRTRNLMAVVQAVMHKTLKDSTSLDDFRAEIEHRLQALARVQGLLSRRDTGSRIDFDLLLREELRAHVALDAAGNALQVVTKGPPGVPLKTSAVQTLALAVHELATNAVKYGALSIPQGRLDVCWQLVGEGPRPRLVVEWQESGIENMARPEDAPRGGGFGRELIERALPYQLGARTVFDLTPDGLYCRIEVEIPEDVREEPRRG